MSLGMIFHIYRINKNITLKDLTSLNLSLSKLSDFENNKTQLPIDVVKKLYAFIGIEAEFPHDSDEITNNLFDALYYGILAVETDVDEKFAQLLNIKSKVRYTDAYISWLLGELAYKVFCVPDKEYNYNIIINILLDNIEILKSTYKRICFDTIGVYLKNQNRLEEAKSYFDRGLNECGTPQTAAMIFYHKSMVENQLGDLTSSMLSITEAKRIFDQNLNIKRSVMSHIALGIVNVRQGNYEKGIEIYMQCLAAIKLVPIKNTIAIYNNLIWSYILSENFEEALIWGIKAINIFSEFSSLYFYVAYANWKLDKIKESIYYITQATSQNNYENPYMKSIILAFSTYIKHTLSTYKIEKMFLIAYKEAKKINDYQLQIFIYEILVNIFAQKKNEKKELFYKSCLLNLYKYKNY